MSVPKPLDIPAQLPFLSPSFAKPGAPGLPWEPSAAKATAHTAGDSPVAQSTIWKRVGGL